MGERTTLADLPSQTLIEVSSQHSTYVPTGTDQAALEVEAAVLVFSASTLSIENPFTLQSPSVDALSELIGVSVLDAYWTDEEIVVEFTGGHRVAVSLRDEDFTSPQAAQYTPSRGQIIVFD